MAEVTFKIRCKSCGNSDGFIHMIDWTEDSEFQLYRNQNKQTFYPKKEIENDEFNRDLYKSCKYIDKSEMVELLEKWHEETGYYCEFCGCNNCFDFWDIKINDELLEEYQEDTGSEEEIKKNDLHNLKLKGKVKSISEISYKASIDEFGKIIKRQRERESFLSFFGNEPKDFFSVFNNRGNATEKTVYNSDGSINKRNIYKYDSEDNLIEETQFVSYDRVQSKLIFNSDNNGKIIGAKGYNNEDKLELLAEFKYNKNNKRVEETFYNSDGSLDKRKIYKYDEKGNIIRYILYNSDGSIDSAYYFRHNPKGYKIEEIQTNKYGMNTKYTYSYDEKGNRTKEVMYNYNSEKPDIKTWVYKYDDNGNIVEWNEFVINREYYSKFTYKYEYDKFNNWIRRIDFPGNEKIPNYVIERVIDYY